MKVDILTNHLYIYEPHAEEEFVIIYSLKKMMLVNISDQSKFVNRDVMVNMIARDVVDPGLDKIRPNQTLYNWYVLLPAKHATITSKTKEMVGSKSELCFRMERYV